MSVRQPLCKYFSPVRSDLAAEIKGAYLACSSRVQAQQGVRVDPDHVDIPQTALKSLETPERLLISLLVPHGAACDGFHVAAHAYQRLCNHLKHVQCDHLTAVLLGTEHNSSTPIALSCVDWLTPLGLVNTDKAAVAWLSKHHSIPVNEAVHASEHSIENQLPFLAHAARCRWDLTAAGCWPASAEASSTGSGNNSSSRPVQPKAAAGLSIVPISVGYLGHQATCIRQYGLAVAELLQHLRQRQQHSGSSCHVVVLIVTSDFTHAGPWYRELPPPGLSLQDYMIQQDMPVLRAVQDASVEGLLAAATVTRNSLCGLYPLAVGLQALYGYPASSSNNSPLVAKPELLCYSPAHLIYPRPDSTGFASLAMYACDGPVKAAGH